jgi:hypothetical protein
MRERTLLGLVIAIVVAGVVFCGSVIEIEHVFQPEGSLFGRPMRIPSCGRSYGTGPDVTTLYTWAQIEAVAAPGFAPVVVEPVIGQIPLFAPFTSQQHPAAAQVCDTVIYLHVGPDAYAAYGLQGGG